MVNNNNNHSVVPRNMHPRGPERHRWNRKPPPSFAVQHAVGICLLLLILSLSYISLLSYQTNKTKNLSVTFIDSFDELSTTNNDVIINTKSEVTYRQRLRRHNHFNQAKSEHHNHHHRHDHFPTNDNNEASPRESQAIIDNQKPQHYNDDEPNISYMADAIVVGSGLAGLSSALHILDRGGTVIIIEKEPTIGGNSNKASSGINACCLETDDNQDSIASFEQDTIKSAGGGDVANIDLIQTLVLNSASAVSWLQERIGIDLSMLVQLGGHSHARTHRPKLGMVGAEIMYRLQQAIQEYNTNNQESNNNENRVTILLNTKVTDIISDPVTGRLTGVECENKKSYNDNDHHVAGKIFAPHVILATGGFASDKSDKSYLKQYRPDLFQLPVTAGSFSTGDGITLAVSLGAGLVDMDKVQIHPTGFIDPNNPTNPSKTLAAELLRGVGGILLNDNGDRFCNELGTRAYVSDKMLSHDPTYAKTRQWDPNTSMVPTFYLVLSSKAAKLGQKHVDLYLHKKLLTELHGINELSQHSGIPISKLEATLVSYQEAATRHHDNKLAGGTDRPDEFGKVVFEGLFENDNNGHFEHETFYVGKVTPVLHYCMGGITIDTNGQVLNEQGDIIDGLHAAGEVTGGVHGKNRLGGNSLLECVVFGSIVGEDIPIANPLPAITTTTTTMTTRAEVTNDKQDDSNNEISKSDVQNIGLVTSAEIVQHNSAKDCWVAIHGMVYDLTFFINIHPGGAQAILNLCGRHNDKETNGIFDAVHGKEMLLRVQKHVVAQLAKSSYAATPIITLSDNNESDVRKVTLRELQQHKTKEDCWVAFYGMVYDMTEFIKIHPGGSYVIQKLAGTDGTDKFQVFHTEKKLKLIENKIIGPLVVSPTADNSETTPKN